MSLAIWSGEGGGKVGEGREADWRVLERVFVGAIFHGFGVMGGVTKDSKSCRSK